MSEETLRHIFEPFFTTKRVGHGSGLGLANVYGIVKQHEGHIEVKSEQGKGTTFRLYFPMTDDLPELSGKQEPVAVEHHVGVGTVLLVEDNEMVREMASELLREMGYTVHTAEHPGHALELARKLTSRIDLVLTDVIMPVMNGLELYEALCSEHSDIGDVLYMSGYTDNITTSALEAGNNFLQKPFTVNSFTAKIRTLMNQS
jgi:CheY-like chemotaxis protein